MSGSVSPLTPDGELFARLAEMTARGEAGVLATVIGTERSTPRHQGSKMIVHADGSLTGSVGGGAAEARVLAEARAVLADGRCRRLVLDLAGGLGVCGGSMEVFLEPVLRGVPFLVIGAGHVGRALLELGRTLPLRLLVIDDRSEFLADLAGRPGVSTLQADPAALEAGLEIPEPGALLIASRGHELDGAYLAAVLRAERRQGRRFAYLGALGSRAKASRVKGALAGEFPELADRLAEIQFPVGLDLGAETPAEIALSILAEALAVLRGAPLLSDAAGRPLGVRLHRRRGEDA